MADKITEFTIDLGGIYTRLTFFPKQVSILVREPYEKERYTTFSGILQIKEIIKRQKEEIYNYIDWGVTKNTEEYCDLKLKQLEEIEKIYN